MYRQCASLSTKQNQRDRKCRPLQERTYFCGTTTGKGFGRRRDAGSEPLRQQLSWPGKPSCNCESAQKALREWGYGLASVRFICGTQSIHKQLEAQISKFLGTEDTILYGSCFDANGGLFETLLDAEDAIISDELNHASIIDGVRLSKAARYRYRNGDMADLEAKLKEAASSRHRLIATDGVFSMDGYFAKLDKICDLAEKYSAMVMVDDSHAVGFIGEHGRGTPGALRRRG